MALPAVPDACDDAVVDPNLIGLYATSQLPSFYAPDSMPTQVTGWRRGAVWTIIVMLLSAAGAGICLTYGPEELWRALGTLIT
jgi:hypothetical protein